MAADTEKPDFLQLYSLKRRDFFSSSPWSSRRRWISSAALDTWRASAGSGAETKTKQSGIGKQIALQSTYEGLCFP